MLTSSDASPTTMSLDTATRKKKNAVPMMMVCGHPVLYDLEATTSMMTEAIDATITTFLMVPPSMGLELVDLGA